MANKIKISGCEPVKYGPHDFQLGDYVYAPVSLNDPLLPAGHQTVAIHVHNILLDSILEVFLQLRYVSDSIPCQRLKLMLILLAENPAS